MDVLIVGSGASAVHAAAPLVERGLTVRVLDFGHRDSVYAPRIPDLSFTELRRSDPDQHVYFLGREFEGIGFSSVGSGAQLTPPRQFVTAGTEERTPVSSSNFHPLESLAFGGLGGAWGAGCPAFTDPDLEGWPLSLKDLAPHYEAVARQIGISGDHDLSAFLGEVIGLQPPPRVDSNAESLLHSYRHRRRRLNRRGFHLGQARLALLTRPFGDRHPTRYADLDFWSDAGRSVYRPHYDVEALESSDRFEYLRGRMVERFREVDVGVDVVARNRETGEVETHRGRTLILAAGTFGTARIVLRSLGLYRRRVPLVCNPHTYMAMLNLNMLGQSARDARHSLAQLAFAHAPHGPEAVATVGHVFSYRSLLLFRLLKDAPLPIADGLRLLPALLSSFAIAIVQHADRPTAAKYALLREGRDDEPETLEIHYDLSGLEQSGIDRIERSIAGSFARLRCIPLRRVRPGDAASVHYGGTFPMSVADEGPLSTDPKGRLRATGSVYLADGSTFPYLPSKGLTFTLMANARRIGEEVGRRLESR